MIRYLLHSPAKTMTLEIVAVDKETNEVTTICLQSGHVYKMPFDPADWKEKGWVREKVDDCTPEDLPDNRLIGYDEGSIPRV